MKRKVFRAAAVVLSLLLVAFALFHYQLDRYAVRVEQSVQPGDLVFQKCLSIQGVAIRIATNSEYDHLGIVLIRDGRKVVLEAIEPVTCTPLTDWIKRTPLTAIAIRRPLIFDSGPQPQLNMTLDLAAREFEGKPYDYLMEWSDDRIYCSELVWKLFQRHLGVELCPLQHLKDFNLTNPLVARQLHKTYGDHISLERTVVSPQSLLVSPLVRSIEVSRW